MPLYWLAAAYALLVFLAALAGGWVPMLVRLTHTRMQIALSFVAGVMLGIGLLHLLPHGYMIVENIDRTVQWTLGGFLAMFFLERFSHFHQHDISEAPMGGHAEHDQEHDHAHVHKHRPAARLSWAGALLGLTLHSLIDGVALAAAMQVEAGEARRAVLVGLGTFLAVVLHKPFDSLTIGTLMAASGWSRGSIHAVSLFYALIAPLGMLLFFLGVEHVQAQHQDVVGFALCFAGGAFLCIATSDLLPEVQFHSHDRVKLSAALLLGVALAAVIVLVESSGHEHLTHGTAHSHDH